jgi:AAA family ATP:ADP antiporter
MQTNGETAVVKPTKAKEEVEGKKEKGGENDEHEFNWLQKWVFPVHLNELAKVLPVVLLMAAALFVYTAYRDVKDPIVYSGEGQSLMTVQYCKVIVMIASVPVAAIFLKLDNVVSRDFIFFQTVLTFASYFLLNGVLLYPNRDALHYFGAGAIRSVRFNNSDENVERLLPLIGTLILPVNTFTYVFSELWGTISVSFLVWGYVNQVTPKSCARRYYAVLGLGGQFGSMFGGLFVEALSHGKTGEEAFVKNMVIINCVMAAICALFAGTYAFLQYYVMKKPQFAIKKEKKSSGAAKPKMSVGEAFKYCFSNPYVMALCGMVFAYGLVMVLGELTYKDVMKLSFNGDQSSYSSFKALETSVCAGCAIFLMIFVGHNVIRIFGWLPTALMAPVIAAVLGIAMYIMALCGDFYIRETTADGSIKFFKNHQQATYLNTIRDIGLIFAVATKSMKYSSFDPAKELAFLALNSEQKYKAKAAVDIIGARFGKGGGALFNILVLNIAFGSYVSYIPKCLIASFCGVLLGVALWVFSDVYIAKNKERVTEENMKEAMKDAEVMESVQVEGGKKETTSDTDTAVPLGMHIEMSTVADASVTEVEGAGNQKQTHLPPTAQ